tara:strand:+ start:777 stop:1034 length:258 start_codon:yes stop_codon:yes gene_type:complete
MRDLPIDENYYEKVLNNFEQFCDEFEFAAAKRFSGVDNDSTAPLTDERVERVAPEVVREVDEVGEDDILARATTIDVPSTEVTET